MKLHFCTQVELSFVFFNSCSVTLSGKLGPIFLLFQNWFYLYFLIVLRIFILLVIHLVLSVV